MNTRANLSVLWVFLTANYIFCDIFSLYYGPTLNQLLTGAVDGIEMSENFLLGFSIVMELPMAMIVGARFLPHRINRIANIAIALLMTLVQAGSLFAGSNTLHYYFFSAVEIATSLCIAWIALRWRQQLD